MTRGQSGLLFLHCWRLSLFTLCRSPGALASVHKDLRLCDLCKELAFGHQCVNGSSRDSYNSLEFNVLWRQFLERVTKFVLWGSVATLKWKGKWVRYREIGGGDMVWVPLVSTPLDE